MPIDPRPTYAHQWGLSYGAIDLLDGGANANYNTLIVKAQHRFSQNFTLLASYTYSHCLQNSHLPVEPAFWPAMPPFEAASLGRPSNPILLDSAGRPL